MSLRDGTRPHDSVAHSYALAAAAGTIEREPAQAATAAALDRLAADLAARQSHRERPLGWLLGWRSVGEPVRGLYIHGGVGSGKTMLMDMFFAAAPVRAKRRVHFNDFMAEVHDRIQRHRQARKDGLAKEDDPIPPVARAVAAEAALLCFDEFTVTDIADAMVLSRLFSVLFAEGVVLVATSNVAPDDLYRNGLNRQLFLPFVALLKRHAEVIELDTDKDYRLEKLNRMPVYLTPLGEAADRAMDEAWEAVGHGRTGHPVELAVKGRSVEVRRTAGTAARFSFAELCEQPLGARDYLAIAARFDTIFIDAVPVLDETLRNPAKRFILLVDTLYDQRLRLVMSAAAPPAALYQGRQGTTEAFEFDRTASRLIEMQSRDWLEAWMPHAEPAAQTG